ncbi:zinc ribbon domain-containing protein [Candidatus Nitrosocosmicus hydrocola]|uniref:zinc ribbon domain-containing protein n=1 Tax=Candidatus Nitrosocosmicus hydrocola TaxID=1826872 RepID=UPI0011E5B98B|nr:zinc ribbon domain-containing protein [Candidatus Nitrosocosmicus hydrocola]
MNLYDSILKSARRGKLLSSYCMKCDKYIWPPNYYCSYCNSGALFKAVKGEGIVLEKGYSNLLNKKGTFAIGEFNGIRIIGSISDDVVVGQGIKIQEIRVTNGRLDIKFVGIST